MKKILCFVSLMLIVALNIVSASPPIREKTATFYGEVISETENSLLIQAQVKDCIKDIGQYQIVTQRNLGLKGKTVVIDTIVEEGIFKYLEEGIFRYSPYSYKDYRKYCGYILGEHTRGELLWGYDITMPNDQSRIATLKWSNFNNDTLRFRIKNFSVYDSGLLYPLNFERSFEEQKTRSLISECLVIFPTTTTTIAPLGTVRLNLNISCYNVSCVRDDFSGGCKFEAIPYFEVLSPFDEWVDMEVSKDSYSDYIFYISNPVAFKPGTSLAAECSSNDGCITGTCLYCPQDAEMSIQTNEDDKKPIYIKLNGSKQGYCGHIWQTMCTGKWNGRSYQVDTIANGMLIPNG
jgi:hypothetical protein